jgi:O-succinylbenzoic acid--CoA ligase
MRDKSTNNFFSHSNRKDLIAIIKSNVLISYDKLYNKAQQIASDLSLKGIEKNSYVPLLIEGNLSFIETTIALWLLGSIPVPLNTKLLDDEIFSIINDYDFRILLTDKNISNNRILNKLKVISVHDLNLGSSKSEIPKLPSQNDEAVVIFTSGSTDRPKGVVHTFSSLFNNIKNSNKILNQRENDRWLASLPFYHIGGFQIICRSLYYGCSIVIPHSLQINNLADAILKQKPTHLSLVSAQLDRLLNQKVRPDKSHKISLIGGGFTDDELMTEADQIGWNPFRVYGSSETASMVTAISMKEINNKPQSVGKAFNNIEIKINEDSEILIKSNSLFKCYLDDKNETTIKFKNGFYHTGDLGFIDKDGYLFIEARRNDLIVSGGENINPIEVEKVILQIEGIRDVCIFAKQDKTWGEIVAAAIVLRNLSIDEKKINEILKQRLAGYKIPKKFYFTDELPRTSLGKLEREKIKKMF